MNRRNRTVIVLLLAVVLASGASYAVYRTVANMPVREVEVATLQVAVAAENLAMGTRIEKEHVKLVGWPASNPIQGGFASIDAVLGRGLIEPISANEPLTETKLASLEAGAGLPPSIPAGMRAMSVKVNEVIGVAGFTVPGTRVDVLVTLSGEAEHDESGREQRAGAHRRNAVRPGAGEGRQADTVDGRHAAAHAGRRGAYCAGAIERLAHARAAQSARCRADRNARCSHGEPDGCARRAARRQEGRRSAQGRDTHARRAARAEDLQRGGHQGRQTHRRGHPLMKLSRGKRSTARAAGSCRTADCNDRNARAGAGAGPGAPGDPGRARACGSS